jgi:hypothetical protein
MMSATIEEPGIVVTEPIGSTYWPRAKNASPANVRSGGYVSHPPGIRASLGRFWHGAPEGQSFRKFLNRPGASAVYLWVETIERWPR